MPQKLLLAAALVLAATGVGLAQSRDVPDRDFKDLPAKDLPPSNGGAGARSGNITSTGATVPNPGASQSAGTTSLDRGIQAEDNKIQGSICKGC